MLKFKYRVNWGGKCFSGLYPIHPFPMTVLIMYNFKTSGSRGKVTVGGNEPSNCRA